MVKLTAVEFLVTNNGQVATLTIPGGPLSAAAARELAATAVSLTENRAIRVVLVRARGEHFCSGLALDLDVFDLRPDPAAALASLRVPVVVGVQGRCHGEGLEIALAADIIIGTPGSTYALDHITDGRIPAWGGSQRLPRAIGAGHAVTMSLLGSTLDAERAADLGLVNVLTDDLIGSMELVAETLISRGPLALELAKEAVHRGSELPLRDGLRLEGDLNHQLAATEDRAEGLLAFFEKRPPDFTGR